MLGGMAVLMVLGLALGGWKKLKNFSTFFKKTLDKQNKVCYNIDNESEIVAARKEFELWLTQQ
jgi:hypothetical protein